MALIVAGLLLFTQAPVDGNYVQHVLPSLLLFGLGAGLSFPALMNIAMSGATDEDAGLASGLVNTTAQVGGALGLAAAGHPVGLAHRGAGQGGRADGLGADRRLPPRVPDRRRPGAGGHGGRGRA